VDHTILKEEAVFAFGPAYIGMHISRFENGNIQLIPLVFESPFVGYNDVYESLEGLWSKFADRRVARRTIFCRNVRQNTDRIARTVRKVLISRSFMRSVNNA
jgi:hypothetical protein